MVAVRNSRCEDLSPRPLRISPDSGPTIRPLPPPDRPTDPSTCSNTATGPSRSSPAGARCYPTAGASSGNTMASGAVAKQVLDRSLEPSCSSPRPRHPQNRTWPSPPRQTPGGPMTAFDTQDTSIHRWVGPELLAGTEDGDLERLRRNGLRGAQAEDSELNPPLTQPRPLLPIQSRSRNSIRQPLTEEVTLPSVCRILYPMRRTDTEKSNLLSACA